jgi:hypothetical protein
VISADRFAPQGPWVRHVASSFAGCGRRGGDVTGSVSITQQRGWVGGKGGFSLVREQAASGSDGGLEEKYLDGQLTGHLEVIKDI